MYLNKKPEYCVVCGRKLEIKSYFKYNRYTGLQEIEYQELACPKWFRWSSHPRYFLDDRETRWYSID